jgi:hypothetical protein
MSRTRRLGLAVALTVVTAAPLMAHHSFAAFDRKKEVTLTGVVREVQWNNPHAWIQMVVMEPGGKSTEWGLECGSPNMMARTGWTRTTVKSGDRVTAVVNPLKDGRPNAALVRITLPDGRVLGPGDAPPPKAIK